MVNETEIKLALGDMEKEDFINSCLKQFPKLKRSQSFQRDTYYDTLDMQLQSKDFVVRVREHNGIAYVALKSPRIYMSEFVQKRIELEFAVDNVDNIITQIHSQDLKPIAIIEKKRITLKEHDFVIEVDELPYIGSFIEIESKSADKVDEIYESLNIEKLEKIKRNYGELLDEKLNELGLPLRPNLRATFLEKE